MNIEPTRLWHIFNWDREREERARCYFGLLASTSALLGSIFIPYQKGWNSNSVMRLGLYTATVGFAIAANRSAYRLGQQFPYRRVTQDAQLDIYCNAAAAVVAGQQMVDQSAYVPTVAGSQASESMSAIESQIESQVPTYDWDRLKKEAVQLAVIAPSGWGKDCLVKWLIPKFPGSQVVVLDSHNKNQPWKPLFVVMKLPAICAQMELFLDELDERIEEGQQGLPDRPHLIVVCNEWLAIVRYCKEQKSKLADRFISRMGGEARKYGIFCIFMVQSDNADAIGLEGNAGLKGCFYQVRGGKAAKSYARIHPNAELRDYALNYQGFICLVDDEPATHPTHGHYPKFEKELPPANLQPLTATALTIRLAVFVDGDVEIVDGWEPETVGSSGSDFGSKIGSRSVVKDQDEPSTEPTNRLQDKGEPHFDEPTPQPISDRLKRLSQLLELKRQGFNKTECIERLWGIKKGGSPKYELASDMYDQMIKELRDMGKL